MKDQKDLGNAVEINKVDQDWQMDVEEFGNNGCLINGD